jgi:hypothetical protein
MKRKHWIFEQPSLNSRDEAVISDGDPQRTLAELPSDAVRELALDLAIREFALRALERHIDSALGADPTTVRPVIFAMTLRSGLRA